MSTPIEQNTTDLHRILDAANAVNGEVSTQANLIARLRSILAGKVGGIIPSGTVEIVTNGLHDVSEFASAQVNIPVGITPSGTKTITANGTHDVTNYASAKVNINSLPTGISKLATGTFTYTSDTGCSAAITHNMGVAPDFYVIFPVSTLQYASYPMGMILSFGIRRTTTFVGGSARTANRFLCWLDSSCTSQYSTTGAYAENVFYTDRFIPNSESGVVYKSNVTYRWIAGKFS